MKVNATLFSKDRQLGLVFSSAEYMHLKLPPVTNDTLLFSRCGYKSPNYSSEVK